jgi:hypothetical protein
MDKYSFDVVFKSHPCIFGGLLAMHHIIFPEKGQAGQGGICPSRRFSAPKPDCPIDTSACRVWTAMDKYFTFPQKSGKKPLQLPGKCGTVHFDN